MDSKSLRKSSALIALSRYVNSNREVSKTTGNNPVFVATMDTRDGTRGVYNIKTNNGGTYIARSITSSGIAIGGTIPSAINSGSGNYIDARPYK